MNIDEYIKLTNKHTSKIKIFLIKLSILIIIFISTLILSKNEFTKKWINNNILTKNISFESIKKIYTSYLGTVLPFDKVITTTPVFSEKFEYSEINKYKDGISLTVTNNYLVPIQYDGIVVFIGEKEGYGNTVIIESDNVVMYYSNIDTLVKLYDEVKKGEYLGETLSNKLYLVFKKDGEVVDYKEFI